MDKPASMIIEDFKRDIANVINNSRLHPAMIDILVSTIAREVHELAIKQAENERKLYEQFLQIATNETDSEVKTEE